jgi:nucleoid-associated protein YgaU
MGQFEKIVVLLILLVCAIVLGISLRSPDPAVIERPAYETGPLADLAGTQGGQLEDPRELAVTTARGPARPPETLSAAGPEPVAPIRLPAATEAPAVEAPTLSSLVDTTNGRALALVRADDLSATASPDYMVYTCRAGDTWHTVAAFYYGKSTRADLLQNANEGLAQLTAGESILVPKYDLSIEGLDREPAAPRETPAYRIYEIESGDTLSEISTAMYGTAARWMQIYDANRDVLASPDSLRVGVKLRIP